jgi:hypothetical protein
MQRSAHKLHAKMWALAIATSMLVLGASLAQATPDQPELLLDRSTSPPAPESDPPAPGESAVAADAPGAEQSPTAPRNELAGFPAIAGNNAFGVLFGVTGSFTRFVPDYPDYAPFRFRAQLTAVASLQGTDSGVRSPLQNIDLRLDFPGLFGVRARIFVMARYQRIENVGYWGIGNGAGAAIPEDYAGPRDRYFTWKKQMVQAQLFVRYPLGDELELVSGLGVRGVFPELWPDTKLARDVHTAEAPERELLYGYTNQLIGEGLLGLLWDTRDDEFNPTRGAYHELSFRAGAGPSRDGDLRYGSTYLHARRFFPLWGERLVLGLRGLSDVGFGRMPLVELGTMGGYTTLAGPASIEANRALPYGRQLGQVKIFATGELRSTFHHFQLRTHRFALGAVTFVDASRVTASISGPRSLEGGPLLRFSFGGGLRLMWGATFVLRLDVGAAPKSDVDGGTHIGASLALGHAF